MIHVAMKVDYSCVISTTQATMHTCTKLTLNRGIFLMGNLKISPDFQQDIRVFRLFVESVPFHLRIFHSFGDVTFAGEGLQILTYARH